MELIGGAWGSPVLQGASQASRRGASGNYSYAAAVYTCRSQRWGLAGRSPLKAGTNVQARQYRALSPEVLSNVPDRDREYSMGISGWHPLFRSWDGGLALSRVRHGSRSE